MGIAGIKIACQLKTCISIPPRDGPKSPPTATRQPFKPSALPRSFPLNKEAITEEALDIIIDAPSASIHLKAIKKGSDRAVAFNSEPSAKSMYPEA